MLTNTPTLPLSQVDAVSNCQQFRTELKDLHTKRRHMITTCMEQNQGLVNAAVERGAKMRAQRSLRSLKLELGVEQVVTERSETLLSNKCSPFLNFNT